MFVYFYFRLSKAVRFAKSVFQAAFCANLGVVKFEVIFASQTLTQKQNGKGQKNDDKSYRCAQKIWKITKKGQKIVPLLSTTFGQSRGVVHRNTMRTKVAV